MSDQTTEPKDIRACVGMWKWRVFVFVSSCPIQPPAPARDFCFEMEYRGGIKKRACPHFCEVETIDWLVAVKCDHPEAVADYG